MNISAGGRLFGTEIEYGCLIEDPDISKYLTPEQAALRVKNYMFSEMGVGLLDEHYRDWGEPIGNGGFLFNGGRLYIDMGHLEYATPECRSVRDLIVYERAMDYLILDALEGLGLRDCVSFVRNNIDHVTGATFGYHENYMIRRERDFYQLVIPTLLPFLVTRQIYAGAGRVGHHEDIWEIDSSSRSGRRRQSATRVDPNAPFQISQRSDHIVAERYQWVQFSRSIINTRDEPLASPNYRRVHLLLGDVNMSEYAHMLKIGTTAAVLQMIDDGADLPVFRLADAIRSLKEISRNTSGPWKLPLDGGGTVNALHIQETFLRAAERHLLGESEEMDMILREWRGILRGLNKDPGQLKDRLDWAAKKWLLETFVQEEEIEWDDPWLQSLDLEYHKIDPERSLYADLVEEGMMRELVADQEVENGMFKPPRDTRALGRSRIMQLADERQIMCAVNWEDIRILNTDQTIEMPEPLQTYEQLSDDLKLALDLQAERARENNDGPNEKPII